MLKLEACALTDVGRRRSHNEDFLGDLLLRPESAQQFGPEKLEERGHLFAIADGMGGHASGEVASRLAVTALFQRYYNTPLNRSLGEHLVQAVREANQEVYNAGQTNPEGAMGTTLTLAVFKGNLARVCNVGDSRTYLMRHHQVRQLTRDHSVVQDQIEMGLISAADVKRSPIRNYITRAIGHKEMVDPDYFEHVLRAGDVFLLCSDGLHGKVQEEEIPGIIENSPHLSDAAIRMVQLANERGGPDNISVLLVRVLEVGDAETHSLKAQNAREVKTAVLTPTSRGGVVNSSTPLAPTRKVAPPVDPARSNAPTDKLQLPPTERVVIPPASSNQPTVPLHPDRLNNNAQPANLQSSSEEIKKKVIPDSGLDS